VAKIQSIGDVTDDGGDNSQELGMTMRRGEGGRYWWSAGTVEQRRGE
jgi:hypothetical protein